RYHDSAAGASVRTRLYRCRMRRASLLVVVGLMVWAPGASAGTSSYRPVTNEQAAKTVFLATPKVSRWLERYPRPTRIATARFLRGPRLWEVSVYSGKAGQIAGGRVSPSGEVVRAWVGPEVVWTLALGHGLGGVLNRPAVWLSLCLVFFLGLGNLRRPLSLRNLDLLVFLSFSVYLMYFNEGRVFASATAAAVPFVYLIARTAWIGATNRASPSASQAPVWLLVAATVLLMGFRLGLNT